MQFGVVMARGHAGEGARHTEQIRKNRFSVQAMSTKLPAVAILASLYLATCGFSQSEAADAPAAQKPASKNAYATMLYMGTPRDYEFYVAARVLLLSLKRLNVDADLVVIASSTVPPRWKRSFQEDGVRVVTVEDIHNPYADREKYEMRFKFTLNKIYAWTLTDYERVIMLDVDNVFLKRADELFQCGDFCAAFINPCIFHTGLFVLKPSNGTFKAMNQDIVDQIDNRDGADQGFLTGHFSELLDRPMFYPPKDGSRLSGTFRLPLGYQMDASYFYLKLKWSVPCGPNSIVTFPSAPFLKPWYWWSYPVLPLGLLWHERRRSTLGYGSEIPLLAAEALFFVVTMVIAMVVRRRMGTGERTPMAKSCFGRGPVSSDAASFCYRSLLKAAAFVAMTFCFLLPLIIIPTTVHPLMGWGVWLLGSLSLLIVVMNIFQLPVLPVFAPWVGFLGALLVMANPFYFDGVVRALAVGGYAFVASPVLWWTITQVSLAIDVFCVREHLMAWTSLRTDPPQSEMMKLC